MTTPTEPAEPTAAGETTTCEVCPNPVRLDESILVLRSTGQRYRHVWHTEPL